MTKLFDYKPMERLDELYELLQEKDEATLMKRLEWFLKVETFLLLNGDRRQSQALDIAISIIKDLAPLMPNAGLTLER